MKPMFPTFTRFWKLYWPRILAVFGSMVILNLIRIANM